LEDHQLESLVLKFLLNRGVASGDTIAKQMRLSFAMVSDFLREMKENQLVGHRRSSGVIGDFEFQLTPSGIEQAKRYSAQSTYCGAAPVPFEEYVASVAAQSVKREKITIQRLTRALADLSLNGMMLSQLGQAMTAGRALFLYGPPGNGKTSIAERLTSTFGSQIWVPRAILSDGEIIRMFDPMLHEEVTVSGLTYGEEIDHRWVRIRRPTVVAGGELTMDILEISVNEAIGVLEAPLQLKSNCGTLVIDDFGRQRMRPEELLNRWIVPLDKGHDYLTLPSGKKLQVPFDQVIVFSTNLDPAQIVDEAFLRRIPYKVLATDPSETEFRSLFKTMADRLRIAYSDSAVDHLITKHYRDVDRPFRYCHARDLMLQIKHLCDFHALEPEMSDCYIDFAVNNYFSATAGLYKPSTYLEGVERLQVPESTPGHGNSA
jgi:predicted ATPase with chaperone activity